MKPKWMTIESESGYARCFMPSLLTALFVGRETCSPKDYHWRIETKNKLGVNQTWRLVAMGRTNSAEAAKRAAIKMAKKKGLIK